jgi:hypothetical protein
MKDHHPILNCRHWLYLPANQELSLENDHDRGVKEV